MADVVRDEVGEAVLSEAGQTGTFVYRRAGEHALHAAFPARIDASWIPASTFKIPNTLIGLETGVIPDEIFSLPWDGVTRPIETWNQDQDLTSALAVSAVWFYQEVARRIGLERMREWVERLDYGNRDIGEEVDLFWLTGPLAISPRQQVDFLERLTDGRLPVTARSVEILERVMPRRSWCGDTVPAKTGTYVAGEDCHAWLVGWRMRAGVVDLHFALFLECTPDAVPSPDLRWDLVERLLRAAEPEVPCAAPASQRSPPSATIGRLSRPSVPVRS